MSSIGTLRRVRDGGLFLSAVLGVFVTDARTRPHTTAASALVRFNSGNDDAAALLHDSSVQPNASAPPSGAAQRRPVATHTPDAQPSFCVQGAKEREGKDSRDEDFASVDPYTRGERAKLDALGYQSLGPFLYCDGIKTSDLDEAIGGIDCLWVETEHFKIGSTLKTYERKSDRREKAKLDAEIAALESRLGKLPPLKGKLDPWLRLHLFAQRCEREYAEFCERFALSDADFGARPNALAPGRFLGADAKFTVFLAEKSSTLSRVTQRVARREGDVAVRDRLAGGSFFVGTSWELVRGFGVDVESALHALLASDLAQNFVDGFRGDGFACPEWFSFGLAHAAARRVDERFALYASPTHADDPGSWRFEPRVYGLVSNGFVPPFERCADWTLHGEMDPLAHLVSWSRVAWIGTFEAARQRALLLALSESLAKNAAAERDALARARQTLALEAALGRPIAELDTSWKQHVLKHYARK